MLSDVRNTRWLGLKRAMGHTKLASIAACLSFTPTYGIVGFGLYRLYPCHTIGRYESKLV